MSALHSAGDRAALKQALRRRYPWLDATDYGPRGVEAGECDRCHAEARMILTCGPSTAPALGRACAAATGEEAWCAGHQQDAEAALSWLAALPPEADDVARLWWVATGEVDVDSALLDGARRLQLPLGGETH